MVNFDDYISKPEILKSLEVFLGRKPEEQDYDIKDLTEKYKSEAFLIDDCFDLVKSPGWKRGYLTMCRKKLRNYLVGDTVADYGASLGWAGVLCSADKETTLFDIDTTSYQFTKNRLRNSSITCMNINISDPDPLAGMFFDNIICVGVINRIDTAIGTNLDLIRYLSSHCARLFAQWETSVTRNTDWVSKSELVSNPADIATILDKNLRIINSGPRWRLFVFDKNPITSNEKVGDLKEWQ